MVERVGRKRIGLKRFGRALGFTLIEMAIVLVVIGLVVSGGLVALGPVIQNAKVTETNQKLDRIEQALIVHVARYQCLPCPADNTVSSGATLGKAIGSSGAYTTSCATCTAIQGAVPWVNLGLSEGDITDGFGARIEYAVTPVMAQAAVSGSTATGLQRSGINYSKGLLYVRNTGGTELTNTNAGAYGSGTDEGAAYVLISHGPNRSYARMAQTANGPISAPNASTQEGYNNSTTHVNVSSALANPFVQDDYHGASPYFDDVVRWRSGPLLVQQCGANNCGNPA